MGELSSRRRVLEKATRELRTKTTLETATRDCSQPSRTCGSILETGTRELSPTRRASETAARESPSN
jgi:hypothetical protein